MIKIMPYTWIRRNYSLKAGEVPVRGAKLALRLFILKGFATLVTPKDKSRFLKNKLVSPWRTLIRVVDDSQTRSMEEDQYLLNAPNISGRLG